MEGRVDRRAWWCALLLALPLGAAGWYTYKIDALDRQGMLSSPEVALFSWTDLWIWIGFAAAAAPLLYWLLQQCRGLSWKVSSAGIPRVGPAAACLFLAWLPVLFVFYPAAGMNDTVYMMENPLRGSIQFPWAPTLFWGEGARLWQEWFGSREGFIAASVLLQMALMAAGLAWASLAAARLAGCTPAGWGLLLYFALFPMCGNYAAAAVRDPLYSLALLGWMILLARGAAGRDVSLVPAGLFFLGLMVLRNNGIYVSLLLAAALAYLTGKRRVWLLFLGCALASVLPGAWILRSIGEEPLFQEAAAVPLQQAGRVLVTGGVMDEEMKKLLVSYLPEEKWRAGYSPYTVDFVKWDPAFRHDRMTETKRAFLAGWARTGMKNPGIYAAGWMTETYALWNLDPLEHQVQSRFGWALTDEGTAHMEPADNDRINLGSLSLPSWLTQAVVWYSFEGSRFLGAGLCLWISLFIGALFYVQRRGRLALCCLPLWANAATLLVSTPASAVFRYSFAFVLGLPVLLVLAGGRKSFIKEQEKPHGMCKKSGYAGSAGEKEQDRGPGKERQE